MTTKLIQVEYDFDYIEELSRFTETQFNHIKEEDFKKFHAATCYDYNVSPIFELKSFQTDNIAEEISDRTGWLVLGYKKKSKNII
jgi:hypothetical protein